MKTIKTIESNVEDLQWSLAVGTGEDDPTFPIDTMTDEQLDVLAKRFGCKPEFIQEINWQFNFLRDSLAVDLSDIWKRLDSVENGKAMRVATT